VSPGRRAIVLGCLWLAGAGFAFFGARQVRTIPVPPEPADWLEAPARVVQMVGFPCSPVRPHRGMCYRAVVEYAVQGTTFRLNARTHSQRPAMRVGDALVVLYDPAGQEAPWLQPEHRWQREWDARDRRKRQLGGYASGAILLATALLTALFSVAVLVARAKP
jgi:uncharacterized protein DUF3592